MQRCSADTFENRYLLRRAAFRAVSASSSVLAKSRPTVASPSPLLILQKQLARPAIQVRLYSDETRKPIDAFAESGKESTNEAQTSPPAVEETPASTIDETATTSAPLSNRSSSSGGSILYVGNMFFEVTEEQLRALFSKFGTVKAAKILYDQRGLSKGFVKIIHILSRSPKLIASAVMALLPLQLPKMLALHKRTYTSRSMKADY